MKNFEHFAKSFKDPDRRYAIYPIIHSGITSAKDFDYYDRCGFAGVVGNTYYNMVSPTDTSKVGFPDDETAWQRTEEGFRGFAKHGMHTWIYDESGYPSGTAGGYVLYVNIF